MGEKGKKEKNISPHIFSTSSIEFYILPEEQESHFGDDYSKKSIVSGRCYIKRVSDMIIIIQQGVDLRR